MADRIKKERVMKKARSVINAEFRNSRIKSDVNGSYTGVPEERTEKPVQDADDL